MGARHLGVGEETTWGTAVTPTRFFEVLSESVHIEKNFENIETIRNYSTREIVKLTEIIKGDVEILANYDGIGILFKHLLGSVDTVTGSINTHTFPASTGIPSTDRIGLGLTLEVQRDGSLVWTYAGGKLMGLTHSFGLDQSSRMTLSMMGKSETTASSGTTASYSTLLPLKPPHITVNLDASALSASSCTLTVENPLDEPFLLGSTGLGAEPDRSVVLKVSASIDLLFDDFTEYDKFSAESDVDIQIVADNGTESLTYNLDKCRILSATPAVSGRERLTSTLDVEAFYNSDATENLQIVLANNDATP